jgi:mannose-1-phosphate guanylyltransferase/mannose-6-phosphate isomerase
MRRASGLPASRVLVEPERRNTAMACAWIALRVQAEDPDAVLAVLPADHHVPDEKAFAADIERAARAARAAGVLVTLGVEPTRPETGYGYIQVGKRVGRAHPRLHQVQRFVEKPKLATARRYLAGRKHLWNAGVFVWSAATFLDEVEKHAPDLHAALEPLRARPRSRSGKAVRQTYALAPSLPVDVAVIERSQRVWTLPVRFAWSDVGTWESLAEELGVGKSAPAGSRRKLKGLDADGNHVVAGEVLCEDSSGNLIWGGRRMVALLGVDNLAVIDCDDVILVTRLDRSPDVRRFVAELKARGRSELL